MEEIIKILLIIGVYQAFVTAILLFTRKTNRVPNRFLSIIIIFFSLPMMNAYIMINHIYHPINLFIKYALFSNATLFGPLVYFYTYNMINIDKPLKIRKFLIHSIPFAFTVIFLISILFHWDKKVVNFEEVKSMILNYRAFFFSLFAFNHLSGLIYTLFSYQKVLKHTKSIENYYSDIEKISLIWLKKFLSILLLFFSILILFHTMRLIFSIPKEIFIIIPIIALSMIFLTTYYVVNQPDIFLAIREMHDVIEEDSEELTEEVQKYKKHNLDEITAKNYVDKLKNYMENHEPHLNDSLTLKELADLIDIPSHHLSIVLNQYLNQNFYNFISYYRIESAKKLLINEENMDIPVLKIAFDSGFNSKSAFNNLFKKSTGKTPTEYRNEFFSERLEKIS